MIPLDEQDTREIERLTGRCNTLIYQLDQKQAEVKRLRAYPAAVDKVRSRYPIDIFPEDGASLDCSGAKFARLLCDQIHELAAEAAERSG